MVDIAKLRADLEAALPPVIARAKTEHYTGGLYKAETMAVYDSKGIGVKNPLRMQGGKVGYLKENFIEWLISRVEAANVTHANS
jgi:hypothetical protein